MSTTPEPMTDAIVKLKLEPESPVVTKKSKKFRDLSPIKLYGTWKEKFRLPPIDGRNKVLGKYSSDINFKGMYFSMLPSKGRYLSSIAMAFPPAVVLYQDAKKLNGGAPIVPVAIKLHSKVNEYYPKEIRDLNLGKDRKFKDYFVVQNHSGESLGSLNLHYENCTIKDKDIAAADKAGVTSITATAEVIIASHNPNYRCKNVKLLLLRHDDLEEGPLSSGSKSNGFDESRLRSTSKEGLKIETEKSTSIWVKNTGKEWQSSQSDIVLSGLEKNKVEYFFSIVIPEKGAIIRTLHWLVPDTLCELLIMQIAELQKSEPSLKQFIEVNENAGEPLLTEPLNCLKKLLGRHKKNAVNVDTSPSHASLHSHSGNSSDEELVSMTASSATSALSPGRARSASSSSGKSASKSASKSVSDNVAGNARSKLFDKIMHAPQAIKLVTDTPIVHKSTLYLPGVATGRSRASSEAEIALSRIAKPAGGPGFPITSLPASPEGASRMLLAFKQHAVSVAGMNREKSITSETISRRTKHDSISLNAPLPIAIGPDEVRKLRDGTIRPPSPKRKPPQIPTQIPNVAPAPKLAAKKPSAILQAPKRLPPSKPSVQEKATETRARSFTVPAKATTSATTNATNGKTKEKEIIFSKLQDELKRVRGIASPAKSSASPIKGAAITPSQKVTSKH